MKECQYKNQDGYPNAIDCIMMNCNGCDYYKDNSDDSNKIETKKDKKKDKKSEEERYYEEREKRWIENLLFVSDADSRSLLLDTIMINSKSKYIKELLESKRQELLDKMKEARCNIAIDLDSRTVVSVSKSSTRKKEEFNLDKFKKDYPDLYKEYTSKYNSTSSGGNLTIRKMTDRDYEIYKSISDNSSKSKES